MKPLERPSQETIDLLKRTGANDLNVAMAAQHEMAKALELPLRQGILVGDVVRGFFRPETRDDNSNPEYQLDIIAPGTDGEYVAYCHPGHGRIPQATVSANYITIPTYRIANAIDWLLKIARAASWDMVARAMAAFEAGFVKKINDDGLHTLLAAATDRNIVVYDADANVGQFTKRLVSLAKTTVQRNGGGNTTSLKRFQLTDIVMSPENLEGVRNWGLDQVDEFTRRDIYLAGDGSDKLTRVFGVNLHPLVEFGENQQMTNFWTSVLGGTFTGGDVEIMLGLDMTNTSNVMPIVQELEVYPDQYLHREGKAGVYGTMEVGMGCLDAREMVLLSN